jgi:hypothetical protein
VTDAKEARDQRIDRGSALARTSWVARIAAHAASAAGNAKSAAWRFRAWAREGDPPGWNLAPAGEWLARHYVALVFAGAALVCIWAAAIGLLRVPLLVGDLLDQLRQKADDPEATRGIVVAMAAILATITIFGTLIVQSIRVWTSERQTRTVEQGHVTDRLTKAIEQLGAEKSVKRELPEMPPFASFERRAPVVETTVPNLEVRLGAIYALERIARDSERDRVTVMEILCAYIRENARARDVPKSLLDEPVAGEDGLSPDALRTKRTQRDKQLDAWREGGGPRVDIQAAATVIGSRTDPRVRRERAEGFRLDLTATDLRFVKLPGARLERADLRGARLERADLRYAGFRKSNWAGASNRASPAQFADFRGAQALTQAQLDQLIGNEDTLLPDGPSDTGAPFHVWGCWETPPEGFDALVARVAERTGGDPDSIRAEFLCGPDNPRRKTGTPWPLDKPRPEGHPLGPD